MEVEMGKLNGFFIDATLKWGTASPYDIFTNATEDEFKALLEIAVKPVCVSETCQ